MKATWTDDARLYNYIREVSLREPDVLRRLREETAALPMAGMQISPMQGQFMGLIAQMIGARKALEVGVFTGYSALAVALALPHDGRLVACDVSEEWTSIGRRYWQEAKVADRIDLRLAPALQTLDALIADGQSGTFDMAFIDADKANYENYYERCLTLVRTHGVILVDNVLWDGRVYDESNHEEDTEAIRRLNKHIFSDARVSLSMLPLADGVTVALKLF